MKDGYLLSQHTVSGHTESDMEMVTETGEKDHQKKKNQAIREDRSECEERERDSELEFVKYDSHEISNAVFKVIQDTLQLCNFHESILSVLGPSLFKCPNTFVGTRIHN